MYPSIETIKNALLHENYISEEDSKAAEAASHDDSAGYVDYLIRSELLSKSLLGQALAEAYRLPYADLGAAPIDREQVAQIPEDVARAQRVVLAKATDDSVIVATDAPAQLNPPKLAPH